MLLALGTMMLHPAATAMMANMTMVNPRRMNIMFAKDPSDGTNQITASPMRARRRLRAADGIVQTCVSSTCGSSFIGRVEIMKHARL